MPSEFEEASILKISPQASREEIKRAYRREALRLHPDQNPSPDAARHFRRLTEAFEKLLQKRPASARHTGSQRRTETLDGHFRRILATIVRLCRVWPDHRWDTVVDGLPTRVWILSTLDELARFWPDDPRERRADKLAVSSSGTQRIRELVQDLEQRPFPLDANIEPRAHSVLEAAEARLWALERPARSSGHSS